MRELIGELLEVAGYIRSEMNTTTMFEKEGTTIGMSDNRILITSNVIGDHTISTTLLDDEHVALALHAVKVIDLRVMIATECPAEPVKPGIVEPVEEALYPWPCFGRSCGLGKALAGIKRA